MYTAKSWIVLIAALVLTLGLVACGDEEEEEAEVVRGSGNVVTEEMAFADFTAVEAANAFVVDISQSDSSASTYVLTTTSWTCWTCRRTAMLSSYG